MEGSVASDFTRMPRCMIPMIVKTACADRAYCVLTADELKRIKVARLIMAEMSKDNAAAIDTWNTHIQPKFKAWIDGTDRLSVALAIVWAGCTRFENRSHQKDFFTQPFKHQGKQNNKRPRLSLHSTNISAAVKV
jgi:hypothetical protein